MKSQKLTTSAFLLAMLMSRPIGAIAADIRPIIHGSGSYRELVIEGPVETGDFDKFVDIIRDNQGQVSTVYIFSPGGDFYEAMKIGRAMRALELGSKVPMRDKSGRASCGDGGYEPKPNDPKNCTCASAGFFIHIGGIHRGGTFLAVHRPYFEKGKFGKLPEGEAKKAFDSLQDGARDYMQAMGVPKHIQEDVLGTPSDRALILDEKTVKTYFWGQLPHRHEWVRNRCSRLSDDETARLESYSRRLLSARTASEANLTKAGWADLQTIQKKQNDESDCAVSINKKSRIDAYEKYFRVKPSDYANHSFSKWSAATKYLGGNFDDILAKENFSESKMYIVNFLNQSATANAPAVTLSDSPSKTRVVASISLISTPFPSSTFIKQLTKSLEGAWGKASGGNGTNEWIWDKNGFRAKLVHEPVAADGPYLNLRIDE